MKIARSERGAATRSAAEQNLTENERRPTIAIERRRVVLGALAFLGSVASTWRSSGAQTATPKSTDDAATQLISLKEVGDIREDGAPVDWFREDWNFDADSFALPAAALEAIDASLEALAARLNPDGSFGSDSELFGRDPGVAGLCGLAFLAAGSAPGRGRFGGELEKIVGYVLSQSFDAKKSANRSGESEFSNYLKENGLNENEIDGVVANFRENGRKPMYGHGFATLFLAATLGAGTNDAQTTICERTRAAVELIVRAQNADGGWRYEPKPVPVADLSVTVCQLSALRAAKDAGIFVPNATVEKAVAYVERCQNSDGGFRYMTLDGPSGIARTAAAILALQSGGADDSDAVAAAFRYLEKAAPIAANVGVKRITTNGSERKEAESVASNEIPRLPTTRIEYYFYGEFYAALAYWRSARDTASKERWARWARRAYPNLLSRRDDDGLWRSNVSTDAETALVLCALLTPFERAPFFLR
ncbi:MAG: terpene cyclase/mutase family protein [Thermoguttaceae bacterium]|nr:terpene cyclase/mutase family protein [Thermoguttaceae bacterium]